ncbi:MAG: 6-phosphogluconolactonase, partial [Hydrogenophaga sp.]|nr:6-phosphogluconolactonase [Hydrogenophaga sp.]
MAVTEHPNATPAALAEHIASALRTAISARGQASLAVSGGKSPIPLFEALREQDLDWSKVTIVLLDERVVPRDHADSNTALVARHLLQGRA